MAYLRRMVNGHGLLRREAFELKVRSPGKPGPLVEALPQFDTYLSRMRLDAGTLIIFDRHETPAPVAERSGIETIISPQARTITITMLRR